MLGVGTLIISGCNHIGQTKIYKQARAQEAEKSPLRTLTVYFATREGYMVPITYPFTEPSADPARSSVEILLEGPDTENLFRTIPKGTRLKDCYVSNETAFVDFTEEFTHFGSTKEATKAVKSLCLTLGSISGVEMVQVLVEGQPVDEIQGVCMGQILKHSWANYFGSSNTGRQFKVYFADTSAMYMIPVTYVSETSDSIPRKAVEKLVKGPDVNSLAATVWPGTKLLDLKIKGGLATVNFSKEVTGYGGGTTAESLFIKALLLTLGQFSDIKGVQILVEGEKIDFLPEGTQISIPLRPLRDANCYAEGL